MKKMLILLTIWCPLFAMAQETHVIEPAILEVRYDSWQEEHDDSYILRVGKTANQFFSFYRNRTDSLDYTNEETRRIALNEFIMMLLSFGLPVVWRRIRSHCHEPL